MRQISTTDILAKLALTQLNVDVLMQENEELQARVKELEDQLKAKDKKEK